MRKFYFILMAGMICIFLGPLFLSAQEVAAGPLKEAIQVAFDGEMGSNKEELSEKPLVAIEAPRRKPPAKGMDALISLDLRDIDIIDALKFLSIKAGLDIVTTKSVKGRVTLMVEDVVVRDVFDIMLRSNQLAYDQRGDIYNVMGEDEFSGMYGIRFYDSRVVKMIRLKYAIPEQVFNLLDTLKTDIGRVLVNSESGNVLIIDIPDRIEKMEEVLVQFEEKNEIRVFNLQYANAKEVEEYLRVQLNVKNVGLIKADERLNQVMVQTLSERMKEIEQLIKKLDRKTKEVIIETNIIKIRLSDGLNKGTTWEGIFDTGQLGKALHYVGSTPFTTVQSANEDFRTRQQSYDALNGDNGSYPFSGYTSNYSGSIPSVGSEALHVGIVGGQDFDVALSLIQNLDSTKILANPKIVVINNQESRIHVGEKQAYVTTTTTTGQATSTVAEDVTFVDIGTQISITPTINDDGYVTMKVKAEISAVTSTLTTPTQNKIPIIDTSLAETTVMVKDGTTIILGGMRRDEKTNESKQTPWLGNIPFFGNFFKTDSSMMERSELLIMLTPRIVTGDVLLTEEGRQIEDPVIKGAKSYEEMGLNKKTNELTLPPPTGSFKGLR